MLILGMFSYIFKENANVCSLPEVRLRPKALKLQWTVIIKYLRNMEKNY